jgi:hypothetical protein
MPMVLPSSAGKAPQAAEIEDGDAAVFDGEVAGELEHLERAIDALPRDAGEVTDLLLRNRQLRAEAGVEHGVEQCGQAAGDAGVGVEQALGFEQADELAEPPILPQPVESAPASAAAPQDRLTVVTHSPLKDLADNTTHGEFGTKLRRTTVYATQFRPVSAPAAELALSAKSTGYFCLPATSGSTQYSYYFAAPVDIPDDALLCYASIYAYDTTTTHINVVLVGLSGGFQATTGNTTTIPATPPGAGIFLANFQSTGIGYELAASALGGPALGLPNCVPINKDVLHGGYQYLVEVGLNTAAGNAQAFRAIEFGWYRQISAAPASASFNDVLTIGQLFRESEATKGSGVTTGCGSNLYCPDATVTRGQMAAFFARALGL